MVRLLGVVPPAPFGRRRERGNTHSGGDAGRLWFSLLVCPRNLALRAVQGYDAANRGP